MKKLLKDHIAALRREAILAAAAKVFAKRGYRSATMRDVADAAGVAEGTIYNVFENKAGLLLALLEPLEAALSPAPMSEATSIPPAFIADAVIALHRAMTPERLGNLRVVLSEALVDPELRRRFSERFLAPAIEPLIPVLGGPCPQLTARVVVGSVLGLLLLQLLGDKTTTEAAPEMAALLGRALTHLTADGSHDAS